jgi:phosphoadenosine phosphosulfate reductase
MTMTTTLRKTAEARSAGRSADVLNQIFGPLAFKERLRLLYQYFSPQEVLLTSSFGTNSAFLLHLISQVQPRQKVYFIDTTYHFPETLAYKEELTRLLGLEVIDIMPDPTLNRATAAEAMWKHAPGTCCQVNKVLPLEPLKAGHQVWISGVMAYQTEFRSTLRVFEPQGHILKFHPLIDVDEGEFLYHLGCHKLPPHPLERHGYGSIGCMHCTAPGAGRSGRWQGQAKTECGLHPNS